MLEKVQQRATKLIPEVKHLSYSERLKSLKLPTLEYRRQRADQIQVFKIMNELEDLKRESLFEMNTESRTRGHKYKVRKPKCKSKTRQLFSLRCVNDWNNLPSSAVNASSVNQFKNELQKHWRSHPLKYTPYQRQSSQVTRGT